MITLISELISSFFNNFALNSPVNYFENISLQILFAHAHIAHIFSLTPES